MQKYIFLLILLLTLACFNQRPTPDWLQEQPPSQDYWYGIASVDLSDYNYREKAILLANKEIASQIEIHIQSSYKIEKEEVNLDFNEYSKSIIEARTDIILPEVEIVETHTQDKKYYIFTRLKKEVYYQKIKLKKEQAISLAVDYMASAEKNMSIESFHFLQKALHEITPFMDYSLQAEYPIGSGKQINLLPTLYILANNFNNRITLTCDRTEINTTFGINKNYILNLSCVDNITKNTLENFPLKAVMDGNYISSDAITNENGDAQIHLFKITKNIPVQYLKVSVDLSGFVDAFNVNEAESLSIKVNVNPPNLYLDIAENNLDEPLRNPFVMPALKLFLLETYGAEFVNIRADSDYYILANINTTAKMDTQNEYGLYQVYADGTISFFNTESNKEIYQKSINNIMGADFNSLEGAGRNALKKMVDKMETSTFQEIIIGINDFLSKNN